MSSFELNYLYMSLRKYVLVITVNVKLLGFVAVTDLWFQDMCVVCGSFGLGAEGRLLACAQCGQCYHPFCVGLKVGAFYFQQTHILVCIMQIYVCFEQMNKVVLSKGWRCLECTVCEACGQATDPGRLLLCDDCDISYHTYCLDPPLQNVPKESWKCKW